MSIRNNPDEGNSDIGRSPLPNSPDLAYLLALLSLPQMGPSRLTKLLESESAESIWVKLRNGVHLGTDTAFGNTGAVNPECQALAKQAEVSELQMLKWCRLSKQIEPDKQLLAYQEQAVEVAELGSDGYPSRLSQDIEPPVILFWKGDISALQDFPTAAIVGTRSCSNYGQEIAFEMGYSLSAAGVCVVSGLALGIDAAAHKGALTAKGAPPVAVVGSGLNMIYPKSNRNLWKEVAARGLLLSETPLDIPPDRWRFPARNRIIAALSDVVVVVESMERGGALFTAEEAAQRDKPVFAVPGPIRSPASLGTNRLLAEGCMPLCDVNDILVALGVPVSAPPLISNLETADLDQTKLSLLEAFSWQPASLNQLVERTGMLLSDVALNLDELLSSGHIMRKGLWYERNSKK